MANFVIDMSGRGGIADLNNQNTRHQFLGGEDQLADGVYNPFLKPGYLAPANATHEAVTVTSGDMSVFSSCIYDALNDDFYLAGQGVLYKGDGMADTTLTLSVDLAGSNVIKDLEIYQVNGVRKMFVCYNNTAGKAEVAISSLPYDSSSDDTTWLTGTVSGGFTNDSSGDVFMVTADNGYAYLFIENQVHKIDGTVLTGGANGTVTPNSLLFPTGFKCTDAVDANGLLYIAVHKYPNDTRNTNPSFVPSGPLEVGVYVWDRKTSVAGTEDFILAPGVRDIRKLYFTPSGKMRIIGITNEGLTVICEYNGNVFAVVNSISESAFPYFRDSVTTFQNMIAWNARDGYVYAHGNIENGAKDSLHKLAYIAPAGTHGGVLLPAARTSSAPPALYVTGQGSNLQPYTNRVKIFTSTSQTGTEDMVSTEISSLVRYIAPMSVVHSVFIFCAPAASGSSATASTVSIYLNGSSTPFANKVVTRSDIARGYVHLQVNERFVNSVQLGVSYPSGVDVSANSFFPMYALVNYTPTPTIR